MRAVLGQKVLVSAQLSRYSPPPATIPPCRRRTNWRKELMEAASVPVKGPAGSPAVRPELKRGAISYLSNLVIGVASTAPGYSLAATIGFIVAISGIGGHMPAGIIVSVCPMVFFPAPSPPPD